MSAALEGTPDPGGVAPVAREARRRGSPIVEELRRRPLLWLGVAGFALPTMLRVARLSWSTEQGAHGPIVLATGIWLMLRSADQVRAVARPEPAALTWLLLVPMLLLFVLARVTALIEVEGVAMYASLVIVAFGLIGRQALKIIWFPIYYLLFMFPPPDSLFAMITQPLKIGVSEWVTGLLDWMGYPVARSGVSIYIGPYELLVAAACAGVYSMISLSAIGLFYTYIRHNSNWRYMVLLMLAIIPVAIVANIVRAMLLVLVTYHFGDAAGQGFFHDFAGLTMFTVALLGIFLIDLLGTPIRRRLEHRGAAA